MDKAVLLKGFLPEDDVELPSGTGTVRVRGLSRIEAVAVQKGVEDKDSDTLEIRALARGVIDPQMWDDDAATYEDKIATAEANVQIWRSTGVAADVQAVAKRISELSNLDDKAGKGPTSNSRRTRH